IPIWYCLDCKKEAFASIDTPLKCRACGSLNLKQDEDVLDTWFSSWLWPFATFYWPADSQNQKCQSKTQRELEYFYPTSTLVTAPEIIFFWVARMIMAGFEFMGKEPFKDVYIHGTVRDIEGKKMSKSLGNIIDPLDIIKEYGTDALRFSLIFITSQGQDVYLSKEKFEQGRNFANKIWNASRFILMNLQEDKIHTDLCVFFKKSGLGLVNRWILSRFYSTLKQVNINLDRYKFNEAANLLYVFFWHEFCDWYLEMIKNDINSEHNQVVMYKILEKFLRALHPFMPFISEEIWQKLPHEGESIMKGPWPHVQEQIIDKKTEKDMSGIIETISAIRNMRAELELPLQATVDAKIFVSNKTMGELLTSLQQHIRTLAKVNNLQILGEYSAAKGEYATVVQGMHIAIPLAGLLDADKYKHKIDAKITLVEQNIRNKEGMLKNKDFLKWAPQEVVNNEKTKLKELKETLTKLKGVKDGIG
ncbi:MAG: class I tRNA ligase family protein, partial [Candidatus Omnitrophica bacterium]|nr:class I tRNA ligase family protein [Candidatus Omnitrophota bacterium]